MGRKRKKRIPLGAGGLAVLAGFGALMYLKNRILPRYADDYAFSFVWDGKHHGNLAYGDQVYKRVRDLKDLAGSQVSHYLTWSGRTVAETMNQLLQMKDDKKLYDRINTAVILAQLLVCAIGGRDKKVTGHISASLIALLGIGYWFGAPYIVSTAFWMTGATNYSWPGLLQSVFLLPYGRSFSDIRHKASVPLMAASGLLAGWSNEAGGAACVLLSGLSYLRAKKAGGNSGWMLAGVCGACAGYALLMLAPGNIKRLKVEKEYSDILSLEYEGGGSPVHYDLYTPGMFADHFVNGFLPVMLRQFPLQLPVALYLLQGGDRREGNAAYPVCLELAAFSVPAILMLSPQFPVRAAYMSVLFSMTAASYAWQHLDPGFLCVVEKPLKGLAIIGCGAFAVNYLASLVADADISCEIRDQLETLIERKDEDMIILPNVSVSDFWSRLAGDRSLKADLLQATWLDPNPEDPYNKAVAAYYGTGAISVLPVSKHPYEAEGREAFIYKIHKPIKSLIRSMKMLFGEVRIRA